MIIPFNVNLFTKGNVGSCLLFEVTPRLRMRLREAVCESNPFPNIWVKNSKGSRRSRKKKQVNPNPKNKLTQTLSDELNTNKL